MWSKSCSSFPPDTYACRTYPQEVTRRKVFVFSLSSSSCREQVFLTFSGCWPYVVTRRFNWPQSFKHIKCLHCNKYIFLHVHEQRLTYQGNSDHGDNLKKNPHVMVSVIKLLSCIPRWYRMLQVLLRFSSLLRDICSLFCLQTLLMVIWNLSWGSFWGWLPTSNPQPITGLPLEVGGVWRGALPATTRSPPLH